MAKLTKTEVRHVAQLARLGLTEKGVKKFQRQLSAILDYVDQLNEVDTTSIEPISQVTGLENVTREDATRPSLTQEEALSNAPDQHNGFFKVKPVF